MKEQHIIIKNNKGQNLAGFFYENRLDTLIIFCHGTDSFSQHLESMQPFIRAYYGLGISLFFFDFTGYGKSEGKGVFNHSQRVYDIGSVVAHFRGTYKKIILCGVSLGVIAATIAAITYKEITKLYLVNGYYYLRFTSPRFYLMIFFGFLFNKEVREESLYAWKNLHYEKITIPTLIVVGEKDQIVNPKQSITFYNQLKCKKQLLVVPNGDHALLDPKYIPKYFPTVKQWILEK